jgi:UDP-N-acetylmuramyl pentapeptide phosphotransferase/UDP-N-acetylglucosamine-1-phosphate transferase
MMKEFIFPLIICLTTYTLIIFCNKNNFLNSYKGEKHQNYNRATNTPLVGGLILFIMSFYFLINNFIKFDFFIFIFFFFILGTLADIKKNFNPTLRFLIQFILLIFFVKLLNIKIVDIRIDSINSLLAVDLFAVIFTAFCFAVLVNGSNFIDGNNTLLIGYYLIITIVIIFFNFYNFTIFNKAIFLNILIVLILLFFLNFFQKLMMGDSGAYIFSILFGYILVQISKNNFSVSPYYIAILLWYPAFENLFSIVRKIVEKKSPLFPDTKHLHQLLFLYLKNRIKFRINLINSITSNLINFYNLIIFLISGFFAEQTKLLGFILLVNILFYITFYFYLIKATSKYRIKSN